MFRSNNRSERGMGVIMWLMEEFRRKYDSFETWFDYLKRAVRRSGNRQLRYTDQSLTNKKPNVQAQCDIDNRANKKIKY